MSDDRKSPLERAVASLDSILDTICAGDSNTLEATHATLETVRTKATEALVHLRPALERKLVNRERAKKAGEPS